MNRLSLFALCLAAVVISAGCASSGASAADRAWGPKVCDETRGDFRLIAFSPDPDAMSRRGSVRACGLRYVLWDRRGPRVLLDETFCELTYGDEVDYSRLSAGCLRVVHYTFACRAGSRVTLPFSVTTYALSGRAAPDRSTDIVLAGRDARPGELQELIARVLRLDREPDGDVEEPLSELRDIGLNDPRAALAAFRAIAGPDIGVSTFEISQWYQGEVEAAKASRSAVSPLADDQD